MLYNSWQAGRQETGCGHVIPLTIVPKVQSSSKSKKSKSDNHKYWRCPGKTQSVSISRRTYETVSALILISQQWAYDLTECHQMSRLWWIIFIDIYLTTMAIFRYLPIYDSTVRSTTKGTLYTNLIAVDLWYLRALETCSIAKCQLIHLLLSLILIKHTSVI